MKAMLCRAWGGPDTLELGEVPRPVPGPGQVVVDLAAAGVNFADTLMVQGKYQEKPPFPFSPGLEAAGTIGALGEGVEGLSVGQRVMVTLGWGGFAEAAAVARSDVFPIPDSMDFATAAGFPITYGTAHAALCWHARLQPGETLLITGAAGGVGLAAVEVGKALGARVIAAANGRDRLAIAADHGADELIDYTEDDLRQRTKDLTGGRGADVVFDPVGGATFEAALRATAWGGRLLVIGFAGGTVQQIPANLLLVKNVAAMGVYWGSYRQQAPHRLAEQYRDLFRWFEAGHLKPRVGARFPLAQANEALLLLANRKATGKVVVEIA